MSLEVVEQTVIPLHRVGLLLHNNFVRVRILVILVSLMESPVNVNAGQLVRRIVKFATLDDDLLSSKNEITLLGLS